MKRIALLLTLSTALFAVDNSDIIWTWGNGNSIASIFSFLYFLLNIDSLETLIKISGIIGMLIVFAREWFKGEGFIPTVLAMKMFFFFVIAYGTINFFLTVKQDAEHRVYILSANELSSASWAKCRPVNGDNECYAPIGIKLIFSTLTNFEKAGVSSMESAMMDANALTYSFSRMGYGFGLNYAETVSKLPVNANQYNTFMEFYENCLLYDFADGTKKINDLYTNKDLALFLLSTNSRLTTVYNTANPNGIVKACFEVAETDLLGSNTCTTKVISMMASSKGTPASETDVNSICTAGENFTQALFDSTKTADDNIKQNISIKLMNEALVNSAITSGISPSDLAYGTTMAQREMQGKWTTMGILAKEYIPSMRGIMQGIAIGLTWVLALMSIATASPAPYLGSIIGFQVTLMLWSFMLALINFMMIDRITGAISIMFIPELGAGDQLTLMTSGAINEELQKGMAFLGYMAVASYGVSAGLVKIGGNMLSSLGNGVGQISVGMGVSSDMARGHQDYGLTTANSSGVSTINKRGDMDKINADGYRQTQESRSGYSETSKSLESTQGGGFNTMTKHSGANGEQSLSVKNQSGDQSITMGDNGVTSANISGLKTDATQSFNHSVEGMKSKSATMEQSATKTLSNSIGSTSTTAQEFIEGVAKEKGSSAGVDTATTYNEQVQSNLQKSNEKGQINNDTFAKLRSIDYSAGVKLEASASGGFTLFGNGGTVTGSASASAGAKASGQHNQSDSIQLTEKEAEVLSKSMATGLSVTAKTTEGVSNKLTDSVMQKTGTSLSQTEEATQQFSESRKLAETAQKLEKYAEANGVSMNKDLMLDVANSAIYGNEALGIRGLGVEKGTDMLFNNKAYLENIANKVVGAKVAETIQKVDTNPTFAQVGNGINNGVTPVNTSNPRTANIGEIHQSNQHGVQGQGNTYLNNMPDVNSAPMIPSGGTLKQEVRNSKYDHSNGNIGVLANPTSSIINAGIETVQDVTKDGNFKISADGTYTDRDGKKHDWSNKGESNLQPSMSSQNNPSPQVSNVQPTTQNVDKGHDVQTPSNVKGESNSQPSMSSQNNPSPRVSSEKLQNINRGRKEH